MLYFKHQFYMLGQLAQEHIIKRLKAVQAGGITFMLLVFGLMYIVGLTQTVNTLPAQIVSLAMAMIITLGYLSVLPSSDTEPRVPLFIIYILTIMNSALVWSTGLLQSPFVVFYAVLIIIVAQLYNYMHALANSILALVGFIFIYGATIEDIIPFMPILPRSSIDILYQPTLNMIVYGCIYLALFLFTVYSSSSARAVLYRPQKESDLNQTYQEKIIQDMPLGLLIVDEELNILGGNPSAMISFPHQGSPSLLSKYLSLPKVNPKHLLRQLSKNGKTKHLTWKVDTGEVLPVTISVRYMKGEKKGEGTFIVFLEE